MVVSNLQVYGLGNSIRVSKFPMQVDTSKCDYSVTERTKSLANAERGSGHDNFLCGIIVQFDLTFPTKHGLKQSGIIGLRLCQVNLPCTKSIRWILIRVLTST